jgi:hypothetical protein
MTTPKVVLLLDPTQFVAVTVTVYVPAEDPALTVTVLAVVPDVAVNPEGIDHV